MPVEGGAQERRPSGVGRGPKCRPALPGRPVLLPSCSRWGREAAGRPVPSTAPAAHRGPTSLGLLLSQACTLPQRHSCPRTGTSAQPRSGAGCAESWAGQGAQPGQVLEAPRLLLAQQGPRGTGTFLCAPRRSLPQAGPFLPVSANQIDPEGTET